MQRAIQSKTQRKIRLTRPVAILDLETTGVDVEEDRIVQLGIVKVSLDGKEKELGLLVNPEMKIPAEASDVHGITDQMVRNEPTFEQLSKGVAEFLEGCDVAGFNVLGFDLPLLENEFERVGVHFKRPEHVVDSMIIYHDRVKRDLSAAYEFYCDSEHEDAHSALADARATWEILKGQVIRHDDLPKNVSGLAEECLPVNRGFLDNGEWFKEKDGQPVLTKGKHKGKRLNAVAGSSPDYLGWILRETNPPDDTIRMIQKALRKAQ